MKKHGLRVLVGLIAFVIGVSAVVIWFLSQPDVCPVILKETEQTEISNPTYSTSPNGKIEIRFNGFGKLENRPTLKFEVINLSNFPVKYIEYGEKTPRTLVRFNGKEVDRFWSGGIDCGQDNTLNSGESLKKEFFADLEIFKVLNKKGNYEFGYKVYSNDFENRIIIWSEPIKISEELKKEIIKNTPEFLKQTK
jgi:hypothetical protein